MTEQPPPITPEKFVEEWNKHSSWKDLAVTLGMNVGAIKTRAAYYRKKGVKLRKYRKHHPKTLDVAKLNLIARGQIDDKLPPLGEQ